MLKFELDYGQIQHLVAAIDLKVARLHKQIRYLNNSEDLKKLVPIVEQELTEHMELREYLLSEGG